MESSHKAVKELLRFKREHGTSYDVVYGYSGSPLKRYEESDTPGWFIYGAVNSRRQEIGILLKNNERNGKRLMDFIIERVEQENNGRPLGSTYVKKKILEYVRDFYGNQELEFEKTCFFYGVGLFTLKPRTTATVVRKDQDMFVIYNGSWFWTEYDPALYKILSRLNNWKLNRGRDTKKGKVFDQEEIFQQMQNGERKREEYALIVSINAEGRRVDVAFAEIVWQFHHGWIDMDNFERSIIAGRERLSKKGLVIDHLTECRANNFSWALAAIPASLNRSLYQRSRIERPYYFYTVYDAVIDAIKVKCGNLDAGYERKFMFKGPVVDSMYVSLFKKFIEMTHQNNMDFNTNSLLRYWADPEKAHEPDNTLVTMVQEPVDDYKNALKALAGDGMELSFEEMPVL